MPPTARSSIGARLARAGSLVVIARRALADEQGRSDLLVRVASIRAFLAGGCWRTPRSVLARLALGVALGGSNAWAAEPEDLDALVAHAVGRHPEAAALALDADAAASRAVAASRPMDPQWMLAVVSLGAMPDSADPTMGMVGLEQMLELPGVYDAARDRAALDAQWAEGQAARLQADLRESLWSSAARLHAQAEQARLLDEAARVAETALALGRARYGSGAGDRPASPAGSGPTEGAVPVPVPAVAAPAARSGGMGGMGGGGMGGGGMPPSAGAMSMSGAGGGMEAMAAGGMGGGMSSGGMSGQGLAALLRLEAEVARIQAERDALTARREAEERRLALIVGEEAARSVADAPTRYFGTASAEPGAPPEPALAATAVAIAEADLRAARADRRPSFMVGGDVRIMPDGMVDGIDLEVGITVPLWGGAARRVDSAVAQAGAAERRAEGVDRALADASAAARGELRASEARLRSLRDIALPRAHAAWDVTAATWAAGGADPGALVVAWQGLVGITRETVDAELATELARARLARLEGQ